MTSIIRIPPMSGPNVLPPAAVKVVDERGNPVSRVRVNARILHVTDLPYQAITDNSGEIYIERAPWGVLDIIAEKNGFESGHEMVGPNDVHPEDTIT